MRGRLCLSNTGLLLLEALLLPLLAFSIPTPCSSRYCMQCFDHLLIWVQFGTQWGTAMLSTLSTDRQQSNKLDLMCQCAVLGLGVCCIQASYVVCCVDVTSSCSMLAGARGSEAVQRPGSAPKLTCIPESSCVGAHGGSRDTRLQNGESESRSQQVRLRQHTRCLPGKSLKIPPSCCLVCANALII